MLATMALVLCAWVLMTSALVGVGLVTGRFLQLADGPLEAFWLGVATVVIALQGWNLVFAVDWRAVLVLIAVATWGWLTEGRSAATRWGRPITATWSLIAFIAVCAVWLANRSLGLSANGDSGIYHLGAVRWAAEYPVVPGIGHIHPFLAVGHGFFPFAALFSIGPFKNQAQHIVNGLLALGFVALTARGTWASFRGVTPQRIAELTLFPWALYVAQSRDVSSASSDVCEVVVGAALISRWLWCLQNAETGRRLLAPLTLACALCIVKISGAGATLGIIAGTLTLAWRERARLRLILTAAAVCAAGWVPWSIATVLRSGYLPYPGALIAFPVDWRIPRPLVDAVQAYTLSWARGTLYRWDRPPTDWSWVMPRLANLITFNREFTVPIGLAVMTIIAAAAWARRRALRLDAAWVLAPVVTGLLFWFFSAPDERYAGIWIQASAALAAAWAITVLDESKLRPLAAVLGAVALVRIVSTFADDGLGLVHADGLQAPPVATGSMFTSRAGAEIFRVDGLQCWEARLPCASEPDEWLEYREPGNLAAGFRLKSPPVDLDTYRPASLKLFGRPSRLDAQPPPSE